MIYSHLLVRFTIWFARTCQRQSSLEPFPISGASALSENEWSFFLNRSGETQGELGISEVSISCMYYHVWSHLCPSAAFSTIILTGHAWPFWCENQECWREDLEPISKRRLAVLDPLEVVPWWWRGLDMEICGKRATYTGKWTEHVGQIYGHSTVDPSCSCYLFGNFVGFCPVAGENQILWKMNSG